MLHYVAAIRSRAAFVAHDVCCAVMRRRALLAFDIVSCLFTSRHLFAHYFSFAIYAAAIDFRCRFLHIRFSPSL